MRNCGVSPWFWMFWVTFLAQKIDPILLEGFGKAKVDELQGMVAVVLVNLGFEVALAAIKRGNIYKKLSKQVQPNKIRCGMNSPEKVCASLGSVRADWACAW